MSAPSKKTPLTIKSQNPSLFKKAKLFLRSILLKLLLCFGTEFRDLKTGAVLGRGLVYSFNGKIHVIGLYKSEAIIPEFLPQRRITYWKQELGFVSHPVINYENVRNDTHHT